MTRGSNNDWKDAICHHVTVRRSNDDSTIRSQVVTQPTDKILLMSWIVLESDIVAP